MSNNKIILIITIIILLIVFVNSKKDGEGAVVQDAGTQEISGIEIYLTDASIEEVDSAELTISRISVLGDKGEQILFSGEQNIKLKEGLVQKIAGNTIIPDTIKQITIQFRQQAKLNLRDGQIRDLALGVQEWAIDINEVINKDEIGTILIDLPLENAIEIDGDKFTFDPKNPNIETRVTKGMPDKILEQVRDKIGEIRENVQNPGIERVWEKFNTGNFGAKVR